MSYSKEEVQSKLAAIRDNGCYVTFPDGFADIKSDNGSLYTGCGFSFPSGVPFKSRVRDYNGELYIVIEGDFGTNDDGYYIGEQEDLGDEHIMALLLVGDDQKQKLQQLDELELAIKAAADAYSEFSKQHKLGAEVEWSTDPHTFAEWNSSRC